MAATASLELPMIISGRDSRSRPNHFGEWVQARCVKRQREQPLQRQHVSSCALAFKLPESILRYILQYLTIEAFLALEEVDVMWEQVIASCNGWGTITMRHSDDMERNHRLLRRISLRHGGGVQRLELINCVISSDVLEEVGFRFAKLSEVVVSGCKQLTDSGLNAILAASRNQVTEIRAVRCPLLTDESLMSANRYHSESLKRIDFSHCRFITSQGITSLVQGAQHLESIGLKGCPKINDLGIAAIAANGGSLRVLNVGGCGNISDRSLLALASTCGNLECLDISRSNPFGLGRNGISDAGLSHLLSNCGLLQQLNLRGQGRLTPIALAMLASQCPELQVLDIGGCRGIVQDPVLLCAMLKRMAQLEQLSVSFCGGAVDDEHVSTIASECPQLKKFDVDGENVVAHAVAADIRPLELQA